MKSPQPVRRNQEEIHPKKQKSGVVGLKIPNQSEEIKKKFIPRNKNQE